jgi:hypothetical protein
MMKCVNYFLENFSLNGSEGNLGSNYRTDCTIELVSWKDGDSNG